MPRHQEGVEALHRLEAVKRVADDPRHPASPADLDRTDAIVEGDHVGAAGLDSERESACAGADVEGLATDQPERFPLIGA